MSRGRFVYAFLTVIAWSVAVRADPPTTDVRLESDKPATLQQRAAAAAEWEDVCNTPCEQSLDVVSDYRFAGAGLRATAPFSLHLSDKMQRIFATMVPSHRHSTGIGLVAAGVPAAMLGTAFAYFSIYAAAPIETCSFGTVGCRTQPDPFFPMALAGAIFFNLVGAVLLGEGGSLWARSRSVVSIHF